MKSLFSFMAIIAFFVVWSTICSTLYLLFVFKGKEKDEKSEEIIVRKLDYILILIVSFVFAEMWLGGLFTFVGAFYGGIEKNIFDIAVGSFKVVFFIIGLPILISIIFILIDIFKEKEIQFSFGIYYGGSFIVYLLTGMDIDKGLRFFFSYLVSTLLCIIIYLKTKKD